jgi:hypothetical protein
MNVNMLNKTTGELRVTILFSNCTVFPGRGEYTNIFTVQYTIPPPCPWLENQQRSPTHEDLLFGVPRLLAGGAQEEENFSH